eukprot:TRINITY_DN58953_c0_g1_i1.p1 TRINITY_DN58953_c0_g1~~TRINITY_DN58953_c0_g1_i1.p1  ORF type:complete len:386 (-),score=60.44 TRINITY_DN58953_c0_g1_i1:195-1352(-)
MPWWLMLLLVPVAIVVTLIVIVLLVKVCCPTAFFKLQNPPGFILHAMTGGNLPPYFRYWPWQDEHLSKWLHDGDVVCCVAAKSGTTWLLNIVHQIRTLGDPEGFLKHNTHTMPWPECQRYPGETIEETLSHLATLDGMTNPKYPFHVFKSHYKPRVEGTPWKEAVKSDAVVPVRQRPGVKYIICMREGKDVLASFYPFFGNHAEGFKKMWGGFPPTFPDFNANFKFFTEDQPGFYHGYCAQWWPYRNDPNVLLLHYSDLKKDIKGSLRKIASFVGVSVPESSWPLIEEKVSLKWMKENETIFKYDITSSKYKGTVLNDEEGSMIRKGGIGDGKDLLTPEQEAVWEKLNQKYFGDQPGLAEWVVKGGPLPMPVNVTGGLTTPLLTR